MNNEERITEEFRNLYRLAIESASDPIRRGKLYSYSESKKQGIDDNTASMLGFLESLNLASMARTGTAARRDLVAMVSALQQDFDERTSALALGVAQIKAKMESRGGSVANSAWNWAAGTAIGQQIGMKPVPPPSYYPAPDPVTVPPTVPNPHRQASSPPIVSGLNGALTGGGGYIEVANSASFTSTDTQFALDLVPNGGNLPPVNFLCHVDFGTPYDRLPTIQIQANAKVNPDLYVENLTTTGFDLMNRGQVNPNMSVWIDILVLATSGDTHF